MIILKCHDGVFSIMTAIDRQMFHTFDRELDSCMSIHRLYNPMFVPYKQVTNKCVNTMQIMTKEIPFIYFSII